MTVESPTRREVLVQLAGAQKSNRGAPAYSRWINRRLGRYIAAIAYLRGLTPNQVSSISAVFTFTAIAALAVVRPTWVAAVTITVALLIGYAFDSADGQIARLRGGGSPAGEWLDHILDAIKMSAFHLAIAIAWFRFYNLRHAYLLLIPLGFSIVSAAYFFAFVLSDMLRRLDRVASGHSGPMTASVDPGEPAPALRSLIVLLKDYGVLCLSMLLIGLHSTFIMVYTILFFANALFFLVGSLRWFREMSNLRTRRTTFS